MKDFCTTISLDDAFDYYELDKRTISKTPLYYYDVNLGKFKKIKGTQSCPGAIFINSYELCSTLIDQYFEQPSMEKYKSAFEKEARNARNKIVSFLWFFERIDGCSDFEHFERPRVAKVLKKWCKSNGFAYLEPTVYCIND